jgi:DNA-binding NarL/FixJ family response regulator
LALSELRVAIADDDEIVRMTLSHLLGRSAGIRLVAAVDDGAAAVTLAQTGDVDVLILDLEMPGMHGWDALRMIRAVAPSVKVVIHSSRPASQYENQMLREGASAYLEKPCNLPGLLIAIRKAASD